MKQYEQFLINEIKRYYQENNKIPCARDMGSPYPSVQAYQNYFGSWNNALKIAGFKPRRMRIEKIITRPIYKAKRHVNYKSGYIAPTILADILGD